jgi:hypothetical protein
MQTQTTSAQREAAEERGRERKREKEREKREGGDKKREGMGGGFLKKLCYSRTKETCPRVR